MLDPEAYPPALRWVAYGVNLWDGNALAMLLAMLLAGAAAGFASPAARLRRLLERRGAIGAGVGGVMGMPLLMCSACSAPVSLGFYRTGATVETNPTHGGGAQGRIQRRRGTLSKWSPNGHRTGLWSRLRAKIEIPAAL